MIRLSTISLTNWITDSLNIFVAINPKTVCSNLALPEGVLFDWRRGNGSCAKCCLLIGEEGGYDERLDLSDLWTKTPSEEITCCFEKSYVAA